MKQVIQNVRDGKLRVVEVPEPTVRPGHALVRTSASLISAGTERSVVDFARKGMVGKAQARPDLVRKVMDKMRRDGLAATLQSVRARLDEPLPLGYSAAGSVVAVGEGLEGTFRVGQVVAMAGAGIANHAELNLVPRNLLAPVPDGVEAEAAAFGTVAAIALHGIRNLAPGLGDVIAVVGTGLVGLLAVQLLSLAGARVVALDVNPGRLDLARASGADLALDLGQPGIEAVIGAYTGNRGVDGILIAAASDDNAPLVLAAGIARDRARVSLVGKIGTDFPFAEYMKKELSIVVSRSYGPGRYDDAFESSGLTYPVGFVRWTETENLAECVRLMAPNRRTRLDVRPLISHRFPIADAESAYAMVLEGREPHLGVVLQYPPAEAPAVATRIEPPARKESAAGLGVIGAGAYARSVLLPMLKAEHAGLRTVVTARGTTAEQVLRTFGFARAATDPQIVFDDPAIDAVIIAAPHETHADLVARALAAGKAVFVEKPLAIDRAGLARVVEARRIADRFFMVGFNRRFAPYARTARAKLASLPGPKLVSIRVNAGPPPTKAGIGGRILGEMCHFIDLARYLVGSPIRGVTATSPARPGAPCDDVAATLDFTDGSVASVIYTGLGDASASKEVIEAFGAGAVVTIQDFRAFSVFVDGRRWQERDRLGQDKGHRDELRSFLAAVRGEIPAPIDENELVETSLATIAVLESLQARSRISL